MFIYPPLRSFPPDEDIFKELLGDEAMGSGWTLCRPAIKSTVDGVQLWAKLAPDVEPPVADEHRLAELRAIWAEKRRLSTVYVAVMPRLASRLHVREESWIGLLVAVEIRVRYLAQHWIIRTCSTWNINRIVRSAARRRSC